MARLANLFMDLTAGPATPEPWIGPVAGLAPSIQPPVESDTRRCRCGRRAAQPVRSWFALIGLTYCGSVSQGNRIQVSWLTSVMKVSTTSRPAGLA